MQSTTSASIIARRISPSPDCVDDIEPLASTTPAVPFGARWWRMCCSQAKLALPTGGVPNFQRASSRSRSPPQSEMLKGGLARMKSNAQVRQFVLVEAALVVPADVGVDAAHGEVHLAQPPGGVVALLPVDGDVAEPAAVGSRRTSPTARTCRRSRSRGRRRGPCRAPASRPGSAPPSAACRTRRRACPRSRRTGRGSIRRRGRGGPGPCRPPRPARCRRSGRSARRA